MIDSNERIRINNIISKFKKVTPKHLKIFL